MKGSQSQVNFFAKFSLKVQTMREKKKMRQKKRKPCFSELGFAWTMMEKSARLSSFDTNFPPAGQWESSVAYRGCHWVTKH